MCRTVVRAYFGAQRSALNLMGAQDWSSAWRGEPGVKETTRQLEQRLRLMARRFRQARGFQTWLEEQ